MSAIQLVQIFSDTYLMGESPDVNETGFVSLNKCRRLMLQPTPNGMAIAFGPLNLIDHKHDRVKIPVGQIMTLTDEVNLPKPLIDRYLQETTGIQLAKATELPNSNTSGFKPRIVQ